MCARLLARFGTQLLRRRLGRLDDPLDLGGRRRRDRLPVRAARALELVGEVGTAPEQPEAEAEPEVAPAPEIEPAPPAATRPDDEEAARLVALDMALGGVPREETETYLAEHYALGDPGKLLDDVYALAGS